MTSSALPAPTRRLDHAEPLELHFRAQVVAAGDGELALDASAFYPQGGGQNGDQGWLRAGEQRWAVTDTRLDKASGVVWHAVAGDLPPPPVGTPLDGEVDATRRLRQMARHTGEHLLAQAFARVNPAFEVAAVGMRGPDCTLDLGGGPSEADAQASEVLLREMMVAGPLHLETVTVPHTELHAYALRRATSLTGDVRLVMFRDRAGELFDVSACAGTHLPLGNLAAPVTVLGLERVKAGLTRVTFRAGPEAAEYLAGVYRDTRALAQSFSTSPAGLAERIDALRRERGALAAEAEQLRSALAEALVAAVPPEEVAGGVSLRLLTLPQGELLTPVLGATPAGEVRAAVAGTRCGVGSGVAEVDASAVLRSALAATGGRGGGRPELAQGQAEQPQEVLAAVRRAVVQALEG
ncbi:alanine--tRNA ligase-related protein [Deinococcus piscis]|nr:alanyl-tRNA editing protein [Deinococcus piscis]